MIHISYLEHSAFAVYNEDTALIFDYVRGARPDGGEGVDETADADDRAASLFRDGYVTLEALKAFARVYVFVSHGHGDHYDRNIFKWLNHRGVTYVLGYDITDAPAGYRLSPGETRIFSDMTVTARASTDLGVSFMIDWRAAGITLFHAGDLNLWHWKDISTLREIEQAEREFYAAMEPIYGARVDAAFFPVDPRQGALYDAGAVHFISRVQPSLFFPMHFQGRGDVALDFARRNAERKVRVVPLITPGETAEADKDGTGALRLITAGS
jgi:L-ascorbate metabolism protein UlaG (beta-lactamase superfamily)